MIGSASSVYIYIYKTKCNFLTTTPTQIYILEENKIDLVSSGMNREKIASRKKKNHCSNYYADLLAAKKYYSVPLNASMCDDF